MQFNPREDFKSWATGFSGMAGGNLCGSLWFCGIEYGIDEKPELNIERDFCYEQNGELIPYHSPEFKRKYPNHVTWQYNQKVSKIVCQYLHLGIDAWGEYITNDLCSKNGDVFKLNLYPLSFRNVDDSNWSGVHYRSTGFPAKLLYKAWCIQNRFPFLLSLVNKYKPNVLVCTGATAKNEFKMAFSPPEKLFSASYFRQHEIGRHKIETFVM